MPNHPSSDHANTNCPRQADPAVLAAIAAALAAENSPAPATPSTADLAGTPAIDHEHNDGLTKEQVHAMLEESHVTKTKRKARLRTYANLTIIGLFLAICGGAYGWYASSPENQAKVHRLWSDVTAFTSGESKEGISGMTNAYDDSLNKIAVRGEQARVATTALERDADLQEKFGGVAKVSRTKVDPDRERREAEEAADKAKSEAKK